VRSKARADLSDGVSQMESGSMSGLSSCTQIELAVVDLEQVEQLLFHAERRFAVAKLLRHDVAVLEAKRHRHVVVLLPGLFVVRNRPTSLSLCPISTTPADDEPLKNWKVNIKIYSLGGLHRLLSFASSRVAVWRFRLIPLHSSTILLCWISLVRIVALVVALAATAVAPASVVVRVLVLTVAAFAAAFVKSSHFAIDATHY
jgi:uncharacterized membrane protein (DUF485 family)